MKQAIYSIPQNIFIGNGTSDSRKLYRLEEKRTAFIRAAAELQGSIIGYDKKQFWTHSLPAQLLAVLDSFDSKASIAAAIGYLDSKGIKVHTEEIEMAKDGGAR